MSVKVFIIMPFQADTKI